jgi:site-specific recombinase XerD
VPLHPAVQAEAAGYPARGWWFPSPADRTRPMSGNSVSATVSATMRRAGIHGTAHSLRHWYGTTMLRGGANIRVVQENMRHVSLASTQIYTKVDDQERAAAVVLLPVPLHQVRSR